MRVSGHAPTHRVNGKTQGEAWPKGKRDEPEADVSMMHLSLVLQRFLVTPCQTGKTPP